MSFEIDISGVEEALQEIVKWTKKEPSVIVNKAAANTAIQVKERTAKADKAKIEQELRANGLVYKLINSQFTRATGGLGGKRTRKEIETKAKKLIAARKRSAGYNQIAVMLAGKPFGVFGRVKTPKGWASESKGVPSKEGTNMAEALLKIVSPAADKIIWPHMQPGLNAALEDMLQHAHEKLQNQASKVSAK